MLNENYQSKQHVEVEIKETPPVPEESPEAKLPSDTDCLDANKLPVGQVWVKDNEIHVQDVPGQTAPPSIQPTEGVNLFINGRLIKNKTFISARDYLYFELKTEEKPAEIKISISQDGLTAYMGVKLKIKKQHVLVDQPPQQCLVLKTVIKVSKSFPFNLNDILKKIREAGVIHGVDYPAIQKFLANPCNGSFVIARGTSPTEPVDDSVVLLFQEGHVKKHNRMSEGKIDFYSINIIPSVDKNTLLAVKHEGKPGQPGLSVTGKIIMPREPKRIIMKPGKGTRVEKNMVYSTTAGRPVSKKVGNTWLFYIEPHLIRYGDVDITVGNQYFRGNITVYGSIHDSMKIKAGGNVQVFGYINRAEVIAMESVRAGKCIGAQVQAGGDSFYLVNLYYTLKELYKNLTGLSGCIDIIIENPKLKEFRVKQGYLLLLLIEKKFPATPKLLKTALSFLELIPIDMPAEINTLIEEIKENIPPRNLTQEKLQTLTENIRFACEFIEQARNTVADVELRDVFNSTITASNNVHILGKGCFFSRIIAGGNIYIAGVLRGGEVKAKKNIEVHEVGSETGTKTVLETESGMIRIHNKIYDGAVIKIGSRKYEIKESQRAVEFYSDKEEKIRCRKITY